MIGQSVFEGRGLTQGNFFIAFCLVSFIWNILLLYVSFLVTLLCCCLLKVIFKCHVEICWRNMVTLKIYTDVRQCIKKVYKHCLTRWHHTLLQYVSRGWTITKLKSSVPPWSSYETKRTKYYVSDRWDGSTWRLSAAIKEEDVTSQPFIRSLACWPLTGWRCRRLGVRHVSYFCH